MDVYVLMNACVYVYVCMYVCMCMYVYVCMCDILEYNTQSCIHSTTQTTTYMQVHTYIHARGLHCTYIHLYRVVCTSDMSFCTSHMSFYTKLIVCVHKFSMYPTCI